MIHALRSVKRRDLREELIDNVPCVKRQVVVTTEGETVATEFTAWEATQLPHFPYQIRFRTDDGTVTMRFREVRFIGPDATAFEPPVGYTRFDSIVDLQRAAGTAK